MEDMKEELQNLLAGSDLDDQVFKSMAHFVQLFQEYNKNTNLSAIRLENDIWLKHIIDSLMLLKFEKLQGSLIDIGTGGGLPGIPLALACPALSVTLLDSTGKKIKACDYFLKKLELDNVVAVQARAEQLGNDAQYRRSYDVVVAKATAYLPTILAWSELFLKPTGKIILYKTPSIDELKDGEAAAKKLKLMLTADNEYLLEDKARRLLVYKRQA